MSSLSPLTDDAARRGANETQELIYFGTFLGQRFKSFERLRRAQSISVQDSVSSFERPDTLSIDTVQLHTAPVQSLGVGGTGGGADNEDVRRNVGAHHGIGGNEAVLADTAELVYDGKTAEPNVIAYLYVAAEIGDIGHDDVIADTAIVRDMRVGHNAVMVADHGNSAALLGASVNRAEFVKDVVVSDLEAGLFAWTVSLMLRVPTQRAIGVDAIALADNGRSLDHGMDADPRPSAEFDVRPNVGAKTNAYSILEFRGRMYVGGRMDRRRRFSHLPSRTGTRSA